MTGAVAAEDAAAEMWLKKGTPEVSNQQFKRMFDHHPQHKRWRYRRVTPGRRDFFANAFDMGSRTTHNNLVRGPDVTMLRDENAEIFLLDRDENHIVSMSLMLVDLGVKAAAEINDQWRIYDEARAHDPDVRLLEGQRVVLLDKYKALLKTGEYGITHDGRFVRKPAAR